VADIRAVLAKCRENGIIPIDNEPRHGAEGKLIAFINPKTTGGVLIELVQMPEEE